LWVTGEYFDGFRAAELAARGRLDSDPDPHARLAWFKRVWSHSPPGERPLIARARSGPAEAWLFLARTRPRQAVALASAQSGRFAPVFVGDPDTAMQHALLRATARRLKTFGLARLSLASLLAEDAACLAHAFRRAGWTVAPRAAGTRFTLDTAGRSFDEIWDAMPSSLHQRAAAGVRQFQVEVSDLLTPRLSDEIELLAGPDPFLRDLAQDATLDRTLRLGLVHIGEVPVAAQLWTVEPSQAVRHWHGVDPDARHLHAGDHLTEAMLRYLINVDGAARLDLGIGRPAELADWASERHPLVRLDLFNPRAASAWAPALAARAATLVRRRPLD
jgi:hypothetical protein